MKSIFENLMLYEIVLLFLGVFLFVILSGGLIYYIVKKEEIKKLLAFFIIPVIMIAYPSIKEIQIGENKLVINEKIKEVMSNPNDSAAIKELTVATNAFEKRAKSVKDLTTISESYYVLGDSDKAVFYANKAIQKNKKSIKEKYAKTKDEQEVTKDSIKKPIILKNIDEVVKLQNIIVLSKIQKDIKVNPKLLQDSVRIAKKLQQVKIAEKSKIYKYFNKKYLKKAVPIKVN